MLKEEVQVGEALELRLEGLSVRQSLLAVLQQGQEGIEANDALLVAVHLHTLTVLVRLQALLTSTHLRALLKRHHFIQIAQPVPLLLPLSRARAHSTSCAEKSMRQRTESGWVVATREFSLGGERTERYHTEGGASPLWQELGPRRHLPMTVLIIVYKEAIASCVSSPSNTTSDFTMANNERDAQSVVTSLAVRDEPCPTLSTAHASPTHTAAMS